MSLGPVQDKVGSLTAGAMLCGILFGWGVLYLTRHEARECLADLDDRVAGLENFDVDQTAREAAHRVSLARAAYRKGHPTAEDICILRDNGELNEGQADETKEPKA